MKPPGRPPEYGSPEWQALDKDDPLRRESVLFAADCWRLLTASPHVSALLGEWMEWMYRRTMREASWAISEAEDWRSVADSPTYAELARRRDHYATPALSAAEIRARAEASWAAVERSIAAQFLKTA